jgi:hypothetical protein
VIEDLPKHYYKKSETTKEERKKELMRKRKVILIYLAKFQILAQLRTKLEIRNHHSTTNIM